LSALTLARINFAAAFKPSVSQLVFDDDDDDDEVLSRLAGGGENSGDGVACACNDSFSFDDTLTCSERDEGGVKRLFVLSCAPGLFSLLFERQLIGVAIFDKLFFCFDSLFFFFFFVESKIRPLKKK
jgi:hypothetical protein